MARPKTSGRGRKPRKTAAGAKTKTDAAASSQAPAPSDIKPEDMTVEDLIRKLYEDRERAINEKRAAAAVNATVAMGRLLKMLPDKPGRTRANLPRRLGRDPAPPPAKFDGNYNEAARRVALLLGLGAKKTAEEADKAETANGQERDRPS
jgi:hypothetical protein